MKHRRYKTLLISPGQIWCLLMSSGSYAIKTKFNLNVRVSSNINEVIKTVLNFFFFFHDKILQAQKA